ncbi:caspase-10 isoform X2 [Rhinatrema bivittatum]|uniref:caspase-10 isoform X2 n=1 Tax=Rhinatrema bivittatum TaxID=194408 RepID=UPI00112A1E2B|nr:caspase-10 isoform X2 [Rhinatrema bivittatum]
MAFRNQLLVIDQDLGSDDVAALKFLCSDFIGTKKLGDVNSAQTIFQFLMDEDLLNEDDNFLVLELLYIIRQYSLLRKFNCTKEQVQALLPRKGRVSAYRQMLYELSENITSEDQKSMFFLLMDEVPRKQANTMSILDLLVLLEKRDFFSKDKLEKLEDVCKKISPDLGKKVANYKLGKGSHISSEVTESLQEHAGTMHSLAENDNKAENVTHGIATFSLDQSSEGANMDLPCYKMDRQNRGHCLIINNIYFNVLKPRRGTQKDADDLKHVFTWLGLEVNEVKNLSAAQIHEHVRKYGQMNHINRDCFVCCILSHGKSGRITGTDEKTVSIREITTYFTAKNCQSLVDKPKLFFIQACQGEKIQGGFPVEQDAVSLQRSEQQEIPLSESIPDDADFLLGMATVDGFSALRDVTEGTWYIQALCKNLQKLIPRQEDILSILTEVNKDVSTMSGRSGTWKQMPQPAYTLRKRLNFLFLLLPQHARTHRNLHSKAQHPFITVFLGVLETSTFECILRRDYKMNLHHYLHHLGTFSLLGGRRIIHLTFKIQDDND